MALLHTTDFNDGFIAGYHRISGYVFGEAIDVITVTVDSYFNRQAREKPGSEFRSRLYDVYTGNLDPVSNSVTVHAYEALMANADFEDSISDDDNAVLEPGDVPAVTSGLYRWDEGVYDWILLVQPTPIEEIRERAYLLVDGAAGQARLRYISSAPGQAETYLRKETQARTWKASSYAGPAPSFIAAEATVLGLNPVDVAESVIAQADLWEGGKGPEIEATRIGGKAEIASAGTEAAVNAALADTIAALDAL